MENSFFGILILQFIARFKESALWQLLNQCCQGIGNVWKKSGMYSMLFISAFKWDIEKSITYKIFSSPFTLLNALGDRWSFKNIKESIVLNAIKEYLRYILQLNTRFFGGFVLVFTIFYIATTRGITPYAILGLGLGFLGIIMNLHGDRVLAKSWIVKTVLKFIDFEIMLVEKGPREKYSVLYGVVTGGVSGILLFVTSPIKVALMVVGLTVMFFMFYKPEYGLFLTVFIAPILPTKIMLILCAFVAVTVVVRNFISIEHRWHLDDVGFLLVGLLMIYTIGVVVSFTPMSSLAVWFVYLIFIGFYMVMSQLLDSKERVFTVIKLFVLSGTIVSIYGILQYVFGWGVNENWIDPNVFATLTKRAYSTLENPNILGEYLILTVMAGIGLMVTRKDFMAKLGYAGCTAIMIICLLATFSRGCWLGVGFAIAIFITFYNGKLWILSIPLLLIAPLVLPENVITRFTSIGNMEDTSTAIRVKIWLSSLGMGTDFMLTGLGLGTAAYAFVYPFYAYYYIPAHHSHNAFFQVLIEGGIIGLLLFLMVIWRFVKHMTMTYEREHKSDKSIAFMVLAIAAGVGGFFVQGMFDYSFYNYRMVLILWMFICLGTALARVSREKEA